MTKKEIANYNRMLKALTSIAKEYMTTKQIRKESERESQLGYTELLEMTYENIQETAKQACKGIHHIKE